jgi:hypothetical protein
LLIIRALAFTEELVMTQRDRITIIVSFALAAIFAYGFINITLRQDPVWSNYKIYSYECSERKREYFHNFIISGSKSVHAFNKTPCLSESIKNKLLSLERVEILSDQDTFYQIKKNTELFFNQSANESSITSTKFWSLLMAMFMFGVGMLRYIKAKKVSAKENTVL